VQAQTAAPALTPIPGKVSTGASPGTAGAPFAATVIAGCLGYDINNRPIVVVCPPGTGVSLSSLPAGSNNIGLVTDTNSAAFQGVTAITPGTPVAAARSLGFICTSAGTITLTLADSSVIAFPIVVSASLQTVPFAVTNVVLSAGAAGSFWNLK
jgi:hypothetical protein